MNDEEKSLYYSKMPLYVDSTQADGTYTSTTLEHLEEEFKEKYGVALEAIVELLKAQHPELLI